MDAKSVTGKKPEVKKNKVGRPPFPKGMRKETISLALPSWLLDWMAEQDDSRAVLIERAMVEKHGIKKN